MPSVTGILTNNFNIKKKNLLFNCLFYKGHCETSVMLLGPNSCIQNVRTTKTLKKGSQSRLSFLFLKFCFRLLFLLLLLLTLPDMVKPCFQERGCSLALVLGWEEWLSVMYQYAGQFLSVTEKKKFQVHHRFKKKIFLFAVY